MVSRSRHEVYYLFIDVLLLLYCFELCLFIKMVIFLIVSYNMSFALHQRHGSDIYYVVRGYTISRVILRIAMDIIFQRRIVLVMVTVSEGRIPSRIWCIGKYVPYRSRIKRKRVCIIRADMHHYRVVWYSPIASINFFRLRAWIFVIFSILFISEESCGEL